MVTASYITPHPAEFNDMREDLERERRFMGKQWSKREAQILAVVGSTVGMVGDLQGIAGKAMPEIPSLDIPFLEASQLIRRDWQTSRRNPLLCHSGGRLAIARKTSVAESGSRGP